MRQHLLALATMLIISMMLLGADSALAQVPACSDVFPQDITENAAPPDVFDLPPFPDPNDGDAVWENDFTLAAGTYYFESLDIDNGVEITVGGPVLIFVEGDVDIGNNVEINVGGDPSEFVLIGYQNIAIGNGTEINGIIYADDEIELENNVEITGAVTSTDDVETDPNTGVTYDATAVENADFGGLCTNGNGGGGPGGAIFSYFMEESEWTGAAGEVQDSSGNGLNATAVGGADTDDTDPAIANSPGTCRYGEFSNAGQRLTASNSPLINDADSFSIAAWVRTPHSSQGSTYPSLIAYGNTNGDGFAERFELYLDRSSFPEDWVFAVRKANGQVRSLRVPVSPFSDQDPLDDKWVHVVATYNSTTKDATLYLNGTFEDDTNLSGPRGLNNANGGMGLMAHPSGLFDARGFMDEAYAFPGALSPSEVSNLYQNTRPCETSYDHIRLTHPQTGLTCSPSNITVQACSDTNCASLHPDPVEVDFTSPAANWTPDPVTFTGSTTVTLQYTTPGVVILDATAITPPADNPTRCFSGGAETNCEMEFLDSGFVIDVPDHVSDSPVTGSIAAVRADPANPEECVPGFDNETKNVGFWSEFVNPSTGTLATGIDGSAITTASPGTAIPIAFDGNGVGTFSLQYPDVGDVELNARYEGSGDEAGLIMIGQERFIARPARFTLDIPGNPAAVDQDGDVFTTAGSDFEVTVTALNASDNITPNFGRETPAEAVDLDLSLVAPAGGIAPGLVGDFGGFASDCDGNSATAGTACGDFSWPEVGIVSLTPRLASGAYLGTADVVGTVIDHVGRFIPDHFALGSGNIVNRAGLGSCASSSFTYVGERFDTNFTLYARNVGGNTTANYEGLFAFLGGGELNLAATPSPDINAANINWIMGVGDATAQLVLPRSGPEGPYPSYEVTTAPVDSDGVALSGSGEIGSTELLFGRVVIDNAIGSELGPLQLPWRSEYWDGSTWMVSSNDNCTVMELTNDVQLSSSGGDTGDGTATVSLGTGSTSIDSAESVLTLSSGIGSFYFSAPGSPGWVDLMLALDTNWPYLRDDLDGDGVENFEDNPQARASFGLFDGNSQRIYIREIPPQ